MKSTPRPKLLLIHPSPGVRNAMARELEPCFEVETTDRPPSDLSTGTYAAVLVRIEPGPDHVEGWDIVTPVVPSPPGAATGDPTTPAEKPFLRDPAMEALFAMLWMAA